MRDYLVGNLFVCGFKCFVFVIMFVDLVNIKKEDKEQIKRIKNVYFLEEDKYFGGIYMVREYFYVVYLLECIFRNWSVQLGEVFI